MPWSLDYNGCEVSDDEQRARFERLLCDAFDFAELRRALAERVSARSHRASL